MKSIYLDHNGSGPVAKEVFTAMKPWLNSRAGSSAASHLHGREAKKAIEIAREQIAELINAEPSEIIFTSGGTESNNLVIKSLLSAGRKGRILISAVEHGCISNSCRYLENFGYTVEVIPVDSNCMVKPEAVEKLIHKNTILIAVMHSNNEVGTLQSITKIGKVARKYKIPFLSDAVQSIGKEEVNVRKLNTDFLSLSAHKFNGPQGIGALYVKKGSILFPSQHGSGQENGLRSGTQFTAGIVGLGAAAKRYLSHGREIREHDLYLRNYLESLLLDQIKDLTINCSDVPRLINTSSFSINNVIAADILGKLPGISASTGATCHTNSISPSKVLTAMGMSNKQAAATFRFSIGYGTTKSQITQAIRQLSAVVRKFK